MQAKCAAVPKKTDPGGNRAFVDQGFAMTLREAGFGSVQQVHCLGTFGGQSRPAGPIGCGGLTVAESGGGGKGLGQGQSAILQRRYCASIERLRGALACHQFRGDGPGQLQWDREFPKLPAGPEDLFADRGGRIPGCGIYRFRARAAGNGQF